MFGNGDAGSWIPALGTALAGTLTALGALWAMLSKISRERRDAVLSDMDRVIKQQQEEITALRGRVEDLTTRMWKTQDDLSSMRQKEADLLADVRASRLRLSQLENKSGIFTEPLIKGVIVADLKGVIKVISPNLTPLLKFLPKELVGRPVELLVPDDLKDLYREKFKKVSDGTAEIDSSKAVVTYIVDKLDKKIPVVIHLTGWKMGDEGLITAEIEQRPEGRSSVDVELG